jgi:hypothetical protein
LRLAALWLLLFGVYAATLTIPATAEDRYAGDEPHHLLAAKSWVQDGDLELSNQYVERQWSEFVDRELRPSGKLVRGRLHEPQGTGLALLISLPYSLGGARGVELAIAAVAALGFVLAGVLARRLVPEPWASSGALLAGLSAPALAAATTVSPEPVAGTLLAGAALCALKVRERPRLRYAYGGATMLALLPWLDAALTLVALPVAVCLVRWTLAERRRLVALISGEVMLGSVIFFARINETFYGGPVPAAARLGADDPDAASTYSERLVNLLGVWLDPDVGLLRWAPVLALAFFAAWLLWRSRREHVAAVIPERRESERTAELLLAVVGVQWVLAALGNESPAGPWFPGLPMAAALPALAALTAWGLRHARVAGVVLGVATLALSAWVLGDAWLGPAEGWLGVAG